MKALQTSWRFMNSYETSFCRCGEAGTRRSFMIRMSKDGYLILSFVSLEVNDEGDSLPVP